MPPAFEVLLLNTTIPQIQAAQTGDTYLCPRELAVVVNSATDAVRITQTGAGNALLVEDSANPDSTPFVVTAAGDVGIGTNSPLAKLNVVSTGDMSGLFETTGTSNAAIVFMRSGNGTTSGLYAYARFVNYDTNAQDWRIGTHGSNNFSFYNAKAVTTPMVLDTSGNLGIGTTSPLAKLEVNDYVNTSYTELVAFTGAKGSFVGIPTNQLAIVDSTAQAAGVGGEISFEGKYDASNITCFASIGGVKENSTSFDYGGALVIKTRANGGNNTERARITSGGDFQVSSGGSVQVGGTAARATTAGTNRLDIFNGTAPVGTLTNGISIYSSSGEAYVMDAAGNATLFSPHDAETNEWIFKSKHTPTGKVLKIDVERLLKFVNDHFGLDAVHEFVEE